jgi:hypothetical protein
VGTLEPDAPGSRQRPWIAELIAGISYDAELEKTHAHALILVWLNLTPLLNRRSEFRSEAGGSVMVRRGDSWEPLLKYQYSSVTGDGTTIEFTPPADGPPAVVLPAARVSYRENGARLTSKLSAEFFGQLLAGRGSSVDAATRGGSGFTAHRR